MTRLPSAVLLAGLALAGYALGPDRAWAQARQTLPGDVTVVADRLEEIGPDNLLIATGNVEVTRGTGRLLADRVEINRVTGDAVAEGRVIFYDGEDRLTGRRIEYNLKTGTGVVYEGEARATPFYRIAGERLERLGESRYRVRRGMFTTCEDDPPAWSFRFGSGTADLEELLYGTNASVWVKNVPLIPFIPFFAAALRRERQTGFLFPKFGNSTRKGYFVELPFFWAISDSQDATLTPVVYSERGEGAFVEYRYMLSAIHRGSVSGFFLKERRTNEAQQEGHDDNRGWGTFKHEWSGGPGLVLRADINGVTDDLVFKEYTDPLAERSSDRVESNIFLTKSWATWNLVGNLFWYQDLTTRRPVELGRLPEIRLQGTRQPVPGFPTFLYEAESSFTHFVRDVGSNGNRLDVHPRLARPTSVFGFFTITPFVGGRLTAYDKTVTGIRTTRVGGFTVEETTDDARLRQLLELGSDFEARAARVYSVGGTWGLDALLHSVEPRMNYTWIDGHNLDRLPVWTSGIDDLKHTSLVSYSLVNRVRARTVAPVGTEATRWEAVRFTIGHSYDLTKDDQRLGNVTGDLIVDPNRVFRFRGDTSVSVYGDGLQTGTTDLSVNVPAISASVGTRFNKPENIHFLQGGVSAELTRSIVGRATTNWDMRNDVFVENRFALDFKWQCWAFTLEYVSRHRDEDELRFALNLLGVGAPITTSTGLGTAGGAGAEGRR